MPLIKQHYRIDHKVGGVWETLMEFHNSAPMDKCESHYDNLRNTTPDVELRLVRVDEFCERSGKGRVYL